MIFHSYNFLYCIIWGHRDLFILNTLTMTTIFQWISIYTTVLYIACTYHTHFKSTYTTLISLFHSFILIVSHKLFLSIYQHIHSFFILLFYHHHLFISHYNHIYMQYLWYQHDIPSIFIVPILVHSYKHQPHQSILYHHYIHHIIISISYTLPIYLQFIESHVHSLTQCVP